MSPLNEPPFLSLFSKICDETCALIPSKEDEKTRLTYLFGRMVPEIKSGNEEFIEKTTLAISQIFSISTENLPKSIHDKIFSLGCQIFTMSQLEASKISNLSQQLLSDYLSRSSRSLSPFIESTSRVQKKLFFPCFPPVITESDSCESERHMDLKKPQEMLNFPNHEAILSKDVFSDPIFSSLQIDGDQEKLKYLSQISEFTHPITPLENRSRLIKKRSRTACGIEDNPKAKKIRRDLHDNLYEALEGLDSEKFKHILVEATKTDCSHTGRCECSDWIVRKTLNKIDPSTNLTILHRALELGQLWAIDIFAKYGGDLNIKADFKQATPEGVSPLSFLIRLNRNSSFESKAIEKLLIQGAFFDDEMNLDLEDILKESLDNSSESVIKTIMAKGGLIHQKLSFSPEQMLPFFACLNSLPYVLAVDCHVNGLPLTSYHQNITCPLITDVDSLKKIIPQKSSGAHFSPIAIDCFYQILGSCMQRNKLTKDKILHSTLVSLVDHLYVTFAGHLGKYSLRELAFAASWKARLENIYIQKFVDKVEIEWIKNVSTVTELEKWKKKCFQLFVNVPLAH